MWVHPITNWVLQYCNQSTEITCCVLVSNILQNQIGVPSSPLPWSSKIPYLCIFLLGAKCIIYTDNKSLIISNLICNCVRHLPTLPRYDVFQIQEGVLHCPANNGALVVFLCRTMNPQV